MGVEVCVLLPRRHASLHGRLQDIYYAVGKTMGRPIRGNHAREDREELTTITMEFSEYHKLRVNFNKD